MNGEQQHDWLDDVLREGPRYIEDNGFTARVVAALPPPQRKRRLRRTIILGGMSAIACLLGLVVLPGDRFVAGCVLELVTARALHPSLILPVLVLSALFAVALIPIATER